MAGRFTAFVGSLWGVIEEFLDDDGMLGTVLAFMLVFGASVAAVVLVFALAWALA